MDEQQKIHQIFKSYREVNQGFYHIMLKEAGRHGVTPVQLLVIKNLVEHPGCGLGEVAERIQLSCSTTSGIIDRMVNAGLVERTRLETDRRSIALQLTKQGHHIGDLIRQSRNQRLQPLVELSDEEMEHLNRINNRITSILSKIREELENE